MNYTKKIALTAATFLLTSSTFAATATVSTGTSATNVSTPATSVSNTATGAASTSVKSSIDLVITGAPKLIAKTATGVTLEWDKVAGAGSYIVKFGKKSVANSTETNPQYEDESDPVTTTGATIDKLSPNTEYFFSVVVLDKENTESNVLSDELKVKIEGATTSTGTADVNVATPTTLALTNVVPQDTKTIVIEFSAPLSSTEPVLVKVTKISDTSDVPVASSTLDTASASKVIVTLGATPLDPKSSYSITVISAKDSMGNNIQEGVNGIKEFEAPANLAPSADSAALNSATNASGSLTSGTGADSLSGSLNGTGADSLASASGTLAATGALPATGTKENLIVITAMILSFGIVYGYRRRMAK